MITKKYIETIILEQFRKCFPDFPKGKLIKSESPDFILKTSPRYSIGIELTSLPDPTYNINSQSLQQFIFDISSSILKKEEKLGNYRKKRANAYWLIIFADSIFYNENELGDQSNMLPGSRFDRVILFGLFEGKVWDLARPHK